MNQSLHRNIYCFMLACGLLLLPGSWSAAQIPTTQGDLPSADRAPAPSDLRPTEGPGGCRCADGHWYDQNRKSCVTGTGCPKLSNMPDGDKGGGYFAWQGNLFINTPCLCGNLDQPLNTGSSNWMITKDQDAATNEPRPSVAVSSPTAGWGSIPNAKWVSPSSQAAGEYIYKITFCLCQGFKNARLDLLVLADNSVTAVRLNGNKIGDVPGPKGFITPKPVSTNNQAFFKAGSNDLEIVVQNDSNVTGLNVGGTIRADQGLCQNRR